MADFMTVSQRSKVMSKVRSCDTKNEILVRSFLHNQGFRFRKNVKYLPGKPDIVLPKYKSIIFVNGCFWHGHKKCKASTLPKTRKEFWTNKIKANIDRDKRTVKALKKIGWKVIIIWQCEIKTIIRREKRFAKLKKQITES